MPSVVLRSTLFLATYWLLWHLASLFEFEKGVSAFYTVPALIVTFIAIFGIRYIPLIVLAVIIGQTPEYPISSLDLASALHALRSTLVYGGAGLLIGKLNLLSSRNITLEKINLFILILTVSAALSAILFALIINLSNELAVDEFSSLFLSVWMGDWVGLIICTPLYYWIINTLNSPKQKTNNYHLTYRSLSLYVVFPVISTALVTIIFSNYSAASPVALLFISIVLVSAVIGGYYGAIMSSFAINITTIFTYFFLDQVTNPGFYLQLEFVFMTITGLLIGVITDDRRRIKYLQLGLIEWSETSLENLTDAMQAATELISHTLTVERVGIWLYNPTQTSLGCHDQYIQNSVHSSGEVFFKKELPIYFKKMDMGHRLSISNSRINHATQEFTQAYLIPNNIYSTLDVPIFRNRETIGVINCDHTGYIREWSDAEQDFVGAIGNDISLAIEINKRKQVEVALEHRAHHDSLTGLANQGLFFDRLEQGLKHAKRNDTYLAVLFLDIDKFKDINDSLGHDVGDLVLTKMSDRLKDLFRETDTAARLGGDEFAMLLGGFEIVSDIEIAVVKVFQTITKPLAINSHEMNITVCIGVSVFPDDGLDASKLLRKADVAMYRVKEKGRNGIEFHSSSEP